MVPVNLYQCGVAKAASTFFREVFNHYVVSNKVDRFYKTGHYVTSLKIKKGESYSEQTPTKFLPRWFIYNIHCDYKSFVKIPKDESFKAIYIYRDPRELITSTYWSWMLSHNGGDKGGQRGGHPERINLFKKNFTDGMIYTIQTLHEKYDIFNAMLDWVENCKDERIRFYKYEDFFKSDDSMSMYTLDMFRHYKIDIGMWGLRKLVQTFKFSRLSKGRLRGEKDNTNHYRSGVADSYKNEWDKSIYSCFNNNSPDNIIERLGYV